MAGGNFDASVGKVRPGTYFNFISSKQDVLGSGTRGIVMLPLLSHTWGPGKTFIEIPVSAPDTNKHLLGYSVFDENDNMLLIRQALKKASMVKVFIPTAGTKAKVETLVSSKLKCEAKYGGTRGNSMSVAITANAGLGAGYFNVTVMLGTEKVCEAIGVQTIGELTALTNKYVEFSTVGEGTASTVLTAETSTALTGGADGTMANQDFSDMLDACETEKFNVFAFPYNSTTYAAQCASVKSKIVFMRESVGKNVYAVMGSYAADNEGFDNVTNGVYLGDTVIDQYKACAFIAGAKAAATHYQSLTYMKYDGATAVYNPKTHDQAVAAVNNGEMFFSVNDAGDVVIDYDINSLVTVSTGKDNSYKKNRVMRVFGDFSEDLMINFPPAKFDNDDNGWDIMEGIGRALLDRYQKEHAIRNVDFQADFVVDRNASTGDSTYFNVGLQPVDSAEKLYFTITTR